MARNYIWNFEPLTRTIIGLDGLLDYFSNAQAWTEPGGGSGYPPYNIDHTSDLAYRITMAVAGFGVADIKIVMEGRCLTITGRRNHDEDEPDMADYRGLAMRDFTRKFEVAQNIEVTKADLRDGMLVVDLVKTVPESMKPRTISIGEPIKAKAKDKVTLMEEGYIPKG